MRRFKKILFCPLGHKDNAAALRRVAALADHNQANLAMFGAVAAPTRLQRLLHNAEFEQNLIEAEGAALHKRLTRYRTTTDQSDVETIVVVGDPAQSIVEQVLLSHHDLVVVTTDQNDDHPGALKRLLRKCPCPVWVLRPTRARTQRILAAVNPDPTELDLNTTVLELAASLAEFDACELHVVHAWELYGETTMRHSAFLRIPPEKVDELRIKEGQHREAALNELMQSTTIGDHRWKTHLLHGSPGVVIPNLVPKERINMIVMGTVGRSGIAGKVMGNTAEQILDHVRCSVIAVKPAEFISPIPVPDQ